MFQNSSANPLKIKNKKANESIAHSLAKLIVVRDLKQNESVLLFVLAIHRFTIIIGVRLLFVYVMPMIVMLCLIVSCKYKGSEGRLRAVLNKNCPGWEVSYNFVCIF